MQLLKKGYLQVSKIHAISYELKGKKNGIPAVFLHGGPGSQTKPKHHKSFTDKHCVLFFDQRGCGQSTPYGERRENTTSTLVEDIARLMDHVGFKRAKIVGGSWGSTLALCFAIKYPKRVSKLVLRGIYLGTREETMQMMKNAALFSPELTEKTHSPSFFGKVTAANAEKLNLLEYSIMDNRQTWKEVKMGKSGKASLLELHFISQNCFLPPQHIMKNTSRIAHIPTVIIQGQQDLLCPPVTAWKLSKKLKKCRFVVVATGHAVPNIAQLYKKYI